MSVPTRTDQVLAALGLQIARRRGRRAWANCPFHDSKSNTTFFVRTHGERAGNYHCFACKASGPLFKLVAKVRDCPDKEAKKFVLDAGKGHRAPRRQVSFVTRPAVLARRRFVYPTQVIHGPLEGWDTLPQRYAIERGLTAAEVERYNIGFAVDGPLAGRIVFPIRNQEGRIVSFSARSFVDEEPKYKTPRENEYAELDVLFGENLWPPLDERQTIVVTEGAIDIISAIRVTGMVGGALGGSDVRSGHVLALATFKHVIVMTDADPPGDKAAREINSLLGRHATTTRVRLVGTDAAKMALEIPDMLRSAIERARMPLAS